jgi:cation:H+ antiporter
VGPVHILLLLGCAVAIYLACEWFVNAVEWLGVRLRMGTLAVGTVLAAIGTALPESVVTLVAVTLGHGPQSKEIGVGAAMGGPLALATVAYGVTGWMMLSRRRGRAATPAATVATVATPRATPRLVPVGAGDPPVDGTPPETPPLDVVTDPPNPMAGVNRRRLASDQTWFLCIFVVKVGLGLVTFAVKPWLGLAFFAAYGAYFLREMRADGEAHTDADLEPLKLQPRRSAPAGWAVAVQTLVTLLIIFAASQLFVAQLEWAGPALGLPAAVTALLLSPIATELPEVMNAVIWVRQGKTQLALANISGAMMIQATVPSGIGILLTPWRFDSALLLSGLVTMAAIVYLLMLMRTHRFTPARLAFAGAFYAVFAAGLVLLG